MEKNEFWIEELVSASKNQTDKSAFLDFKDKVEALTKKDIQKVAKKYLSKGPIIGILYPEDFEVSK